MAQPNKKNAYDEDLNPNLHTTPGKAVADISGSGSFVSNNPMNFFAMKAKEKYGEFKVKRSKDKELKGLEKQSFEEQYDTSSREQAVMRGQERAREKAIARFDPQNRPINKVVRGFGKIAHGTENLMMKGGRMSRGISGPARSEFQNPAAPQPRLLKDRFIDTPSIVNEEGGASGLLESAFFSKPSNRKSGLETSFGGNIGKEFSKGGGLFGAMSEAVSSGLGGNPRRAPRKSYRTPKKGHYHKRR